MNGIEARKKFNKACDWGIAFCVVVTIITLIVVSLCK